MTHDFATKKQKIQIHTLLHKYGQLRGEAVSAGEKAELARQFSSGRVTSTTGLRQDEAERLIRWLWAKVNEDNPDSRMRRRIIAMAHEMGWETPPNLPRGEELHRPSRPPQGGGVVDMQRVNSWCIRFGQFHKPLNAHNSTELVALVSQFERVYQSYLKAIKTAFQ